MTRQILNGLALAAACVSLTATAATRTSANYSLTTETVDSGGRKTTSAAYSNDGSLGDIGGVSTAGASVQTARHSYIAQLYEVTGVTLSANPTNVNESAARQVSASAALDDATVLNLSSSSVGWDVVSGPITSINPSGLATAAVVYQNEPATVRGTFEGQTGTLGLQVLNVNNDNFGTYAGDALDDAWQVEYFGLNNPSAAPGIDPDGDGQTNRYEYVVGTIPTDVASQFHFRIEDVPELPNRKNLIFSPTFPSRTYLPEYRTNLSVGMFAPVPLSATSDAGTERTVTDLEATNAFRFYRIHITFP